MAGHADCVGQGVAFNSIYIWDPLKKKVQMCTSPSSSLASRNRRSLVQAHTQHPPGSQAHTRLQIPDVLVWSPYTLGIPAWILPLLSAPQVPYS